MKTIWKIPLKVVDYQSFELPPNAQILGVHVVGRQGVVYVLVDTDQSGSALYRFYTVGTGREIHDPRAEYIGTYVLEPLVWHIFLIP